MMIFWYFYEEVFVSLLPDQEKFPFSSVHTTKYQNLNAICYHKIDTIVKLKSLSFQWCWFLIWAHLLNCRQNSILIQICSILKKITITRVIKYNKWT